MKYPFDITLPAQVQVILVCCLLLAPGTSWPVGEVFDISSIDDTPKLRDVEYPGWFKNSFLDLPADLEDARENRKKGLLVYFGQKHCAYCEALMNINFGTERDIVEYTSKHFDVVPIDIWGDRELIDMDGIELTEKSFAEREKANFTPSLIFYDLSGKKILQLRGYYTPYKLRGALEYVVDNHYQKESLRDYMARANPPTRKGKAGMNSQEYFEHPPYNLDRRHIKGEKPLVVFFEQPSCHACDVLHSEPLSDDINDILLHEFEVVQLDMWGDIPVLTPDGKTLTGKQWAESLGLFYAPTLVFFDEQGQEIIRVSSVVRVYRLRGVLEYVLNKGYLDAPTFQRWQEMQSLVVP
ncbi:MAG: thioredoxin family protein [bacterium]